MLQLTKDADIAEQSYTDYLLILRIIFTSKAHAFQTKSQRQDCSTHHSRQQICATRRRRRMAQQHGDDCRLCALCIASNYSGGKLNNSSGLRYAVEAFTDHFKYCVCSEAKPMSISIIPPNNSVESLAPDSSPEPDGERNNTTVRCNRPKLCFYVYRNKAAQQFKRRISHPHPLLINVQLCLEPQT